MSAVPEPERSACSPRRFTRRGILQSMQGETGLMMQAGLPGLARFKTNPYSKINTKTKIKQSTF